VPQADLRDRIREQAFDRRSPPEAGSLAEEIARLGGAHVLAVIFFGSRKTGARPGAGSAYDFFVVTAAYRAFYANLRRAGALRRPAGIVAMLNALMPPNQVSIRLRDSSGADLHAKCAVVSLGAFLREMTSARRDHFFLGRLFQPAEVLYVADKVIEQKLLDALESAHRLTFSWVRPRLPQPFDVAAYCRALFEVSFAAEIRPEPSERIQTLWQAQKEDLQKTYTLLLEDLAARGSLPPASDGLYTLREPVSRAERLRLIFYFRWSKVRATARWAKYIVTFDDWLEFIVRKAERHTGKPIVLTPRERRMPLIFLWPRFFRFLRHKGKP